VKNETVVGILRAKDALRMTRGYLSCDTNGPPQKGALQKLRTKKKTERKKKRGNAWGVPSLDLEGRGVDFYFTILAATITELDFS